MQLRLPQGARGLQLSLETSQDRKPAVGDRNPCIWVSSWTLSTVEGQNRYQKQAVDRSPSQMPSLRDSRRARDPCPTATGLGRVAGVTDGRSSILHASRGPMVATAQVPKQQEHLHLRREKCRLSVVGAAAARAEDSVWPRRYWMERSWKQGSASSTAVARSALRRDIVWPLPWVKLTLGSQGHPTAAPSSRPPDSLQHGARETWSNADEGHSSHPPLPPPAQCLGGSIRYISTC